MNQNLPVLVGNLRINQLLYTFGIGAMIDLPNLSVLVMGLDEWNTDYCEEISEDRLLNAVRDKLETPVEKLRKPPLDPNQTDMPNPFGSKIGLPVFPFPRWLRCPACALIAPIDAGFFKLVQKPYYPDKTRYIHENCGKANNPPAMPVRFLTACKNGHLDDFPWVKYVHQGRDACPDGNPVLYLYEFGPSGEASDIVVKCNTCGKSRRMSHAMQRDTGVLPACQGRHPHLRTTDEAPCTEPLQVILLGASNGWFPVNISVISIPSSENKLDQLVDALWPNLKPVTSMEILKAFRQTPLLARLAVFSDEDIWAAVERKRNAPNVETEEPAYLRGPEWKLFSNPDAAPVSEDFRLSATDAPRGYESLIRRTVMVECIREVRAFLGFTRIESPGDLTDGIEISMDRLAPLSQRPPEWVPAADARGEGLFIQFKEAAVRKWESRRSVRARAAGFHQGHIAWRRMRGIEPNDGGFPGMRYVLLQSFAHMLMRQVSLECGYSASSIRERIYSYRSESPEESMAGVLIYTSAADSEGTLGGLVSLGKPEILGMYIDQAIEEMRFCASDPFCSEHIPAEDSATIHGAACHACLFISETSCERGNKYLDRACLVKTFSTEDAAFFE
jgi:hypothetical protein